VDKLEIRGARENNLKNLNLDIPHNQLVVITGVSGSGKSSLAFQTIYAEGGRRYIETFSPYTRQFLDRLKEPELDSVAGIRPSLALEQRNRIVSSRSTVGTITEINDYLKIIWSHFAEIVCPTCNSLVEHEQPQVIYKQLLKNETASNAAVIVVAFPFNLNNEISPESITRTFESQGFLRFYSNLTKRIEKLSSLDVNHLEASVATEKQLLIISDRFQNMTPDLLPALHEAYRLGHGILKIILFEASHSTPHSTPQILTFKRALTCRSCNKEFTPPYPSLFSFNNPLGACTTCNGFGKILEIDQKLCIPNDELSISEGAIQCWSTPATSMELRTLKKFCEGENISQTIAWKKLSKKDQDKILNGGKLDGKKKFKGVLGWFEYLKSKRHKMHVRVFLSRYRSEKTCPTCNGSRLRVEADPYKIDGYKLQDLWNIPIDELHPLFNNLKNRYVLDRSSQIAFDEVIGRLSYLDQIGLGYLTLDRQSKTLSGGESQRVNLTSLIGSSLVNTMLVLDEPTIGLHARDTFKLIQSLHRLRDRGNTLIVVEHDQDVIAAADTVIDIGPGSGAKGGEIVYQGSVSGLQQCKLSLTAKYLFSDNETLINRDVLTIKDQHSLVVTGASAHNLKSIDVKIPLNRLVVMTGISGSGKSTFVRKCLTEPYLEIKKGISRKTVYRDFQISSLSGDDLINDIILIDQSPIGKTPRANAGTYSGAWDIIRELLEASPKAQELALGKSAFSFNVDGGRCATCSGAGYHRIEMQFLADVFVPCEVCGGKRFKESILSVTLGDKNVAEILDLSLTEVCQLVATVASPDRYKKLLAILTPLLELGLGYLKIGQPLSELSGGEAQRIKLSSYLQEKDKSKNLFIFDEPTTGLHPHNITDLLKTFSKLLERGHSLLVVEHNLDVIRNADWMIELGPEGGKNGGEIVLEGNPAKLLQSKNSKNQSLTIAEITKPLTDEIIVSSTTSTIPTTVNQNILVQGARHHNLRNITVEIPKNKLVAITGVSGSGKSSLAFDIIFQEGQRRYIDSLSPYARQYLTQLKHAEVDKVSYLPPTIAVTQKTAPPMGISTLGTTTEIYQYLRLLFAKAGEQFCPEHHLPIARLSKDEIAQEILSKVGKNSVAIFAPVVSNRKGHYAELFERARKAEIDTAIVDNQFRIITEDLRLERHKLHSVSLMVGRLSNCHNSQELLHAAIEQALTLGNGSLEYGINLNLKKLDTSQIRILSTERACPKCKRGFKILDPQDFSFRSAKGVCKKCDGRGGNCKACNGDRVGPIGRSVKIFDHTIGQLSQFTAPLLKHFLENWRYDPLLKPIIYPILKELNARLKVIEEVGLDYIILDRESSTLSGGEAQRLRLARSIGSPLTGVCYVLDEPTIGLHPSENDQLMKLLLHLKDQGNTVIVVEHDEETIAQTDHIIDIGPGGGSLGGHVVYSGETAGIIKCTESQTGRGFSERIYQSELDVTGKNTLSNINPSNELKLKDININNLKNISTTIPLNQLTVICGVSGAGKSSLVHGALIPKIADSIKDLKPQRTRGDDKNTSIIRLVELDQSPIGKTPTSTPASYLKIFDDIRETFALVPDAKARGWNASYFSANSGKGRCDSCNGRGFIKTPMSFLPDAVSVCEECRGLRYKAQTLEILYQGFSIGEILNKTLFEAKEIFANHYAIRRSLGYAIDLGIGYLRLGQPTHTLSGGEAQRLKIVKEFGLREAVRTLYVLDEPTIGLHMNDVGKLISVLNKLVEKGNTVVTIEHNLDVINAADHLIELGPGPGEKGGNILFEGTPQALKKLRKSTPTKDAMLARQEKLLRILNRNYLSEKSNFTQKRVVSISGSLLI
jgi:excinuclease ABC subunit A